MLRWSVLQPTGVKTGTEREALGRRAVRICVSKDASRFAHGQQCSAGVVVSCGLNPKRLFYTFLDNLCRLCYIQDTVKPIPLKGALTHLMGVVRRTRK